MRVATNRRVALLNRSSTLRMESSRSRNPPSAAPRRLDYTTKGLAPGKNRWYTFLPPAYCRQGTSPADRVRSRWE